MCFFQKSFAVYNKAAIFPVVISFLASCGGGGGNSNSEGTDTDTGGNATVFSGGSIEDLKSLSSALNFDNLVISGALKLPVFSNETITAKNLTVEATGSIDYDYSTCQYVDAPGITLNVTEDVVINGEILLGGRSGRRVSSGASCNSCFGQDGGDISITAANISIGARVLNYGGSGGTSVSSFGSSGCSGGNSGNLTLEANNIDLSNADIEVNAGRGGPGSFSDGSSGTKGNISLTATTLFKMNPGSMQSDSTMSFQAGATDIAGPITYGSINATISGSADSASPIGSILAPLPGSAQSLNEPLEVQVQASDSGLGVREIKVTGFGYDFVHPASEMVDGILTLEIPAPVSDTSLSATIRDNMLNETVVSVNSLTVSYGAEQEPNDSKANAQSVTLPVAIEGSISPSDSGTCDPDLASYVADTNCIYHTAQDYYTFTVGVSANYLIELEFEGNPTGTALDLFLTQPDIFTGWWTWSNGDNAASGIYKESIDVPLAPTTTYIIAIQAWPSWSGSVDYRLTIGPGP